MQDIPENLMEKPIMKAVELLRNFVYVMDSDK